MKFITEYLNVLAHGNGTLESIVWKSLVILALVFAAMALWRRSAAAARHLAWTVTFLCLLFLPIFVECLPGLRPPVWMTSSSLNNHLPDSLKFVLGHFTSQISETPRPTFEKQTRFLPSQKFSLPIAPAQTRVVTWSESMMVIWFAGMMICLTRLLGAQIQLRRTLHGMRICEAPEQLRILEHLRRDYRIKRPVRLLISDASAVPMTWGFWRPIIALPAESCEWTDHRLRVVMGHELAHVKRWDCLTQEIAHVVCALYWFNPLAWLAARRMHAEREKACDDFVLKTGAHPSEYANHLVEIALQFPGGHSGGAVAMARKSGLEQRVMAILDGRRNRNHLTKVTVVCIVVAITGLGVLVGATTTIGSPKPWSLAHSAVAAQLRSFIAEKKAQEEQLIKTDEKASQEYTIEGYHFIHPDCRPFFAAAAKGNWLAVSNLWSEMENRTLGLGPTKATNGYPRGMWRQPVMETYGAIEAFAAGNEKYAKAFGDDIIQSIPPGSIYFGGTDPGRFIVTALEKSQVKGDPFFTLTQNALASSRYLQYFRSMYGKRIYIPSGDDLQQCLADYVKDFQQRSKEHKLKPGEHLEQITNSHGGGSIRISGQTAVMELNGLLVKVMFDKNPGREFFIEQSFPLDWTYPYLEPHGLIFKINRKPLAELPNKTVQQDHNYWTKLIQPMIGNWLGDDTSVREVVDFARRVFLRHDFSGFTGDPQFIQNGYSCKMFSKERSSIAGLYAWRMKHAVNAQEKERMAREADFAYRQAFALCPYSSETAKDYAAFLKSQKRLADATLVTETAAAFPSHSHPKDLKSHKSAAETPKPLLLEIRLVQDAPSADTQRMTLVSRNNATGQMQSEPLYVQKTVLLDQTAIQSVKATKDALGQPIIDIHFTDSGRKKFAEVSRHNIGRRLAIIINGRVCSAPVIQAEITGGMAQITGAFTEQETEALARKINEAVRK